MLSAGVVREAGDLSLTVRTADEGHPRRTMRRPTSTICTLLVLLALYAACYLTLVQRWVSFSSASTEASYRLCDQSYQVLLAPAHWLDRWPRPVYWAPPSCVC